MSDSESKATWSPAPASPVYEESPSLTCSGCQRAAARECLACKASFCAVCASSHSLSSARRHHRLVSLSPQRVCATHNQENLLYCFDCNLSCCLACGEFSSRHHGHRIWDIDSAEESIRSQIAHMATVLAEMKQKLTEKCARSEEQKKDIATTRDSLTERMKTEVKTLCATVRGQLEEICGEIDAEFEAAAGKIEAEREKVAEELRQLAGLETPRRKAEVIGTLYSQLRAATHAHSGEKRPKICAISKETEEKCRAFIEGLELIMDIQSYRGGISLEHRWDCRKCGNKNFPKSAICKKCGTTNRILSSLLNC